MGACIPLRFGIGNHVADSVLSADPAPITTIENLKNEFAARRTVWASPGRDIVIEGRLNDAQVADFFCLPNSTLIGLDEVRLDLFSDADLQTQAHTTGTRRLAEPPPIGVFRAGIDPYGVPIDEDRPDVFTQWLPDSVVYRSFRFVIRQSQLTSVAAEIALRMLVIGTKQQMENNFVYGGQLSYLTPPQLVRTSSGKKFPVRGQQRARTARFRLPMMTDSDRSALSRMETSLGTEAFLVSAYTGREGWQFQDYAYLGRFDDALSYTHRFEGIHATDLIIVEA